MCLPEGLENTPLILIFRKTQKMPTNEKKKENQKDSQKLILEA